MYTLQNYRCGMFDYLLAVGTVSGLFIPRIRTLDFSYYGWTIRTLDDSYDGLFVRWTIRTMDFSYHGQFVLWTVRTIHKITYAAKVNVCMYVCLLILCLMCTCIEVILALQITNVCCIVDILCK